MSEESEIANDTEETEETELADDNDETEDLISELLEDDAEESDVTEDAEETDETQGADWLMKHTVIKINGKINKIKFWSFCINIYVCPCVHGRKLQIYIQKIKYLNNIHYLWNPKNKILHIFCLLVYFENNY